MAQTLKTYLDCVQSTLTAAICLQNFASQIVERHNKPEVEAKSSPELLLNPVVIARNAQEKVLIEGTYIRRLHRLPLRSLFRSCLLVLLVCTGFLFVLYSVFVCSFLFVLVLGDLCTQRIVVVHLSKVWSAFSYSIDVSLSLSNFFFLLLLS